MESGGNIEDLPKLPEAVGGKIDFIIGIKYLHYYPQKIFQMPSGLTIYESIFKNPDESRGVVEGPHKVFSEIERYFHLTTQNASNFLSNQLQSFQIGYNADIDVSILGFKSTDMKADIAEENHQENRESRANLSINRQMKQFNRTENTGTEIS